MILWLFIVVVVNSLTIQAINVALHAQVYPADQVVGSVITTNGLKKAFRKRPDIHAVEVFYPSHYEGFSSTHWDLVIIEGWFVSIDSFIWRARLEHRGVLVLFYCLDPSHPDMTTILSLDVDGYLTNSRYLSENILPNHARSLYLPLAADPDVMVPIDVPKEHVAVYVGAGGEMLKHKPLLYDILVGVSRSTDGLVIYGSSWDRVSYLNQYWRGTLPQHEIAMTYSSANIVIAVAIETQKEVGMINNRIYEALACGAIVISDKYPALQDLAGDLIEYADNAVQAAEAYKKLVNMNVSELARRRTAGRELITSYHTWDHRVIDIMDFYHQFRVGDPSTAICRPNRLRIAWLTSENISYCEDYFVYLSVYERLRESYAIQSMLINENITTTELANQIDLYDVVVAVTWPFSWLDLYLRDIDRKHMLSRRGELQRRVMYVIGVDRHLLNVDVYGKSCDLESSYDMILYRNMKDIEMLVSIGCTINELRMQHVFGFASISISSTNIRPILSSQVAVKHTVLCFLSLKSLCKKQLFEHLLSASYAIMLVGGCIDDWKDVYASYESNEIHHLLHYRGDSASSMAAAIDFLGSNHRHIMIMNKAWSIHSHEVDGESSIYISMAMVTAASIFAHQDNSSSHISFWSTNDYLLGAIDAGSHRWDRAYLHDAIDMALFRLINFGSSLFRADVEWLSAESIVSSGSTCLSDINQRNNSVIFKLSYQYFQPGRDGDVCIVVDEEVLRCMTARFQYLVLSFKSSNNHSVILNDHIVSSEASVDISGSTTSSVRNSSMSGPLLGDVFVKLRGVLAADFFFETKILIGSDVRYMIATPSSLLMDGNAKRKTPSCTQLEAFDVAVFVD
jgi:glycosyltransferase involved in cell wall biosynthesis